ncbi:hypothetical protein QZH41_009648, partial [Actinostola sp. cb2023]
IPQVTRANNMAAYCMFQDALKINRQFRLSLRSAGKIVSSSRRISRKEVFVEVEVGGRPLQFSSGKLAFLADGATVAQYGGTSVLVTATSAKTPSENDFLPLVVDYREKASAACLIPSNFLRRELGPNEREILVSRCIDRSLRSLFSKGYFYDTQIMSNLLVADRLNNPDVIALNGASAALALSDIPWSGPVVMLEGSAMEMDNDRFFEAVKLGFHEAQPIISAIKELQSYAGKEKREFNAVSPKEDLSNAVQEFASEKLSEIFSNFSYKKLDRDDQIFKLRDSCVEKFQEEFADADKVLIEQAFYNTSKDVLQKNILDKKQRCDGRSIDQLRDIKCEVNVFDTLHGSALFDRGETQVFCTVTFGSVGSAAKFDNVSVAVSGNKEKKFMLHYEFPPFATNESKRPGRAGRREVGHGALSEKALVPILPKEIPFTLRLTSQVFASNGSSSMASACAGSLAIMDAGVPIQKHVAGTACGLATSQDANDANKPDIDEYQILTDILGIEDYLGSMDFKIAGTRKGITALQADFKIPGIPLHIVEETIRRGSEDRSKVLDIMENVIVQARQTKKDNCPISGTCIYALTRIITVPAAKRGKIIGLGGVVIKGLEQEFGITLTQVVDEEYSLFAPNQNAYQQAITKINDLLEDKNIFEELAARLEKGAIYQGKIVEIRTYGVMLEVFHDCPTVLLHSKELDHKQVTIRARTGVHPERLGLKEGDSVTFKCLGTDKHGRVMVSRKSLLPPSPNQTRSSENKPRFTRKFKTNRESDIMDYLDGNGR